MSLCFICSACGEHYHQRSRAFICCKAVSYSDLQIRRKSIQGQTCHRCYKIKGIKRNDSVLGEKQSPLITNSCQA